jgi:hypothetical protein
VTTAELAVLVDKFNLRPHEIAKLTDYQIRKLYFHARDEKGIIVFPRPPKTPLEELENDLKELKKVKNMCKPEEYAEAEAKLREKIKTLTQEENERSEGQT